MPALVRVLQPLDIDLVHLQHGLHYPLGFFAILVLQHLAENTRYDLPREAIFVLQPAASLPRAAAGGQLVPKLVNFLLRLATHKQRDGWSEGELWAAVQRVERLPFQLEGGRHDRALRPRTSVAVAADANHF